MISENSLNPIKGAEFQRLCSELLTIYFGVDFDLDHPVPIGSPSKNHKFDLISNDGRYVGECKNYSWTKTGNVPSAKMGFMNEAVFYLTFIDSEKKRFIVMRKDNHAKRRETLAEYYYRTYKHLLSGIDIIEIEPSTKKIRQIG